MKTVLLVDDFENTLFVTGTTLKMAGYKVLKALSGKEALEMLHGEKVDLIISDYNMPEMNGLEFIERAKELPGLQYKPVFILSTEIKAAIKQQAYNIGVTAWIAKPFKIEQLINQVKRALG